MVARESEAGALSHLFTEPVILIESGSGRSTVAPRRVCTCTHGWKGKPSLRTHREYCSMEMSG